MGLRARQPRRHHRPVLTDASDVVAHQVDDHHVLGRVLGGLAQGREVRGRNLWVGWAIGRALDRAGANLASLTAQEQLR